MHSKKFLDIKKTTEYSTSRLATIFILSFFSLLVRWNKHIVSFDHAPPLVSITHLRQGQWFLGINYCDGRKPAIQRQEWPASPCTLIIKLTHLESAALNFTVDTSGFVPDLTPFTVRATDGAGNQAEASITISSLRSE